MLVLSDFYDQRIVSAMVGNSKTRTLYDIIFDVS